MKKSWMISAVVMGTLLGSASPAMARGYTTFGGYTGTSIDFSSAIGSRGESERCKVTMCGEPTQEQRTDSRSDETIGDRKSTGARLGVLPCHTTFCGRR